MTKNSTLIILQFVISFLLALFTTLFVSQLNLSKDIELQLHDTYFIFSPISLLSLLSFFFSYVTLSVFNFIKRFKSQTSNIITLIMNTLVLTRVIYSPILVPLFLIYEIILIISIVKIHKSKKNA